MDPKKSIASLLDTVEKSLAPNAVFRNAYEANNTHASNAERLDAAANVLKGCQLTPADIDALQRRMAALRTLNDETLKRRVGGAGGGGGVVSAADDWLRQLEQQANDEDDEEALAEALAAKKKKEKKEKKDKKEKREKETKEAKVVERAPAAPAPRDRDAEEEAREAAAAAAASASAMAAKVLFAAPNCGFGGLPLEALAGKCTVTQIPNTPCVEVRYEQTAEVPTPQKEEQHGHRKKAKHGGNISPSQSPLPAAEEEVEKKKGTVVAVMYRVVVAALWKGVPALKDSSSSAANGNDFEGKKKPQWRYEGEGAEEEAEAAPEAAAEQADEERHGMAEAEECDDDEEHIFVEEGSAEAIALEAAEAEAEAAQSRIDDTVRECSERLVQEYTEAAAEDDAERFARGRDAPSQITIPTTHFARAFEAPWTVLICHGGYFAGGVFINGRAVVHKAFQRYVVRKGQGGMQSKADKTGGIAKSVGSQIRRQNELKWKVMVRDILIGWRAHIDASWVILYVAPGPENRNILTDFSGIPASVGGGSGKFAPKSPVDAKDPRVRSAPLTTHRPTYAEVQRIYHEVSRVSVRYEEPSAGAAE